LPLPSEKPYANMVEKGKPTPTLLGYKGKEILTGLIAPLIKGHHKTDTL